MELKLLLEELIELTNEEWLSLSALLSEKQLKAKAFLLEEGKVATHFYFIKTGLIRTFQLHDGKEVNTYFASDGQFISSFSSFITQSPSLEYVACIEDSLVYPISYSMLTKLYKQSIKFEKLGRVLAEKSYLCIQDRTLMMQTKTAKEKYLKFIRTYDKKIVLNVPQHQIASFLGITPESLSRIRREIATS